MRSSPRPRRRPWLREALRRALSRLRRLRATLRDEADPNETDNRGETDEARLCREYQAQAERERDAECLTGCDWPDGPLSPPGCRW